jgi:hypothetical protein
MAVICGPTPQQSIFPKTIPNLELWLDANSGTLNVVGNYFTDETATIELAGFPNILSYATTILNGTYTRSDSRNGKPFYPKGSLDGNGRYQAEVFWDNVNNRWEIYGQAVTDDSGENWTSQSYYGVGNTNYPWQATWSNGTLTRTANTADTPATNDQTVAQWNNLVSGKPNLRQFSANLQPLFKSSVNGRKAVFFNGDVLYNSGFSNFLNQYSYYLVSTNLGAQSGTLSIAIRLGSSSFATRGLFGASANFIGASNGTSRFSTISPTGAFGNIWSARFNIGSVDGDIVTVGSKKTYETLVNIGGIFANRTDILLGASNSSGGSAITSDYSEVLVYRAVHDETTANQIIDYLAAKWGITV